MKEWNCLIIGDEFYDYSEENKDSNLFDAINIERGIWRKDYQDYLDITYDDKFLEKNLKDNDIIFIFLSEDIYFRTNPIEQLEKFKDDDIDQILVIFTAKTSLHIYKEFNNPSNSGIFLKKYKDLISELLFKMPESKEIEGTKILPVKANDNLYEFLFKDSSTDFCWKWAINKAEVPAKSRLLAQNKTKHIISLLWKEGKKYMLFLPQPLDKTQFITYCLRNIKKLRDMITSERTWINIKKPSWLENHDLFGKKELVEKKKEISKKLKDLETFDYLLYGYDKPLEDAVAKALSYFGVEVIKRTVDRTDIICETENYRFLIENKGIKGIVTINRISQLYRWYAEELERKEQTEKQLKLLFICNSQREKDPANRSNPFHEEVIKTVENQGWGLISTVDLFNMIKKMKDGEVAKEEIVKTIESKSGVIVFS